MDALRKERLYAKGKIYNKLTTKLKKDRLAIIIYGVFLIIMMIVIMNKRNMHVDETCSYVLANSGWMIFENGYTYNPEQIYLDHLTVRSPMERFNFKNVWENQQNDVHPPLYYIILHIICSYNVGRFSIWHAAGINIFFAMYTLYILRKLLLCFTDAKEIADIISIVFVLSAGVLQNVSFLRMYAMAMFWVTLTTYLFVKTFEKKASWKLWAWLCLVAIAGALTHYYCIIWLCATCVVFGICMIIEKRWRDIAILTGCMAAAASISIAVFPEMIRHMFLEFRGTDAINNITKLDIAERWNRIKSFYGFINEQLFGNVGGYAAVFAVLLIIMFVLLKKNQSSIRFHADRLQFMKWSIVCIPAIIYFLLVSLSAAMVIDRYLFPIYAVTLGIFMCAALVIFKKIFSEKALAAVCFIAAIIIVNGLGNAKWDYLYKDSLALLNNASAFRDLNCIYIYDADWKVQSDFYEVRNYKSLTVIKNDEAGRIIDYGNLFGNGFILKTNVGDDEEIIAKVQDSYPYLDKHEKIGSNTFSTTYRIYTGGD